MFENYKGKPFSLTPNKKKLPINLFSFDDIDEFNTLYKYCRDNYLEVKPTLSQGISNNPMEKRHFRYFCIKGNQRFELVVICEEGCFRFLLENKKEKTNTITGSRAVREIYKKSDELKIDLSKYMVGAEEGKKIKDTIEMPHLEVLEPTMVGKPLLNVFHIDFKSSYASRIVEEFPELFPLYNFMFQQRKFRNEYYKHVLTNSIGCFQSEYCPDYLVRRHTSRYQFALLSKVAINGTRRLVIEYIDKLRTNGFIPLLTNTDGIWYYSPTGKAYHDEREGSQLTQWENDHKNCKFLMTSVGSYQYTEKSICHSVVRGKCNLDAEQPNRDKWKFGAILFIDDVCTYDLDPKKGIVKNGKIK